MKRKLIFTKTIVPFFKSLFLKISFKVICFFASYLLTNFSYSQELEVKSIDSLNIFKNIVKFTKENGEKSKTLILFSSPSTCSKCYEILESYLKNTSKSRDYHLITVVNFIDDKKLRREFIKRYKIFSYSDTIFFEEYRYNELIGINSKTGIFDLFKISFTPSILIRENQTLIYLSYDEIFEEMMLTKRAKKLLKKF